MMCFVKLLCAVIFPSDIGNMMLTELVRRCGPEVSPQYADNIQQYFNLFSNSNVVIDIFHWYWRW